MEGFVRPRCLSLALALSLTLPSAISASAAPLILNEYNAVGNTHFLNGGDAERDADGGTTADGTAATDTFFGRAKGNGSVAGVEEDGNDWFELVVIEDGLDVRGWKLEMVDTDNPRATLVFSGAQVWSNLRAGTIITVAESAELPDDASYDPEAGDWTIHVQAMAGGSGTYITASDFFTSNSSWQLTIRDASGAVAFGPAGEGVSPQAGVSNHEVWKLEADPSAEITPNSTVFTDGTSSTFGAPNAWSGGTYVQSLTKLRSAVAD